MPIEKDDKEKMLLIESIKNKIELEIASTENGFAKKKKANQSFTAYLNLFIINNGDETGTRLKFNIEKFTNDAELMFDEITFVWIEDFKRYLEKSLSQNTVRGYLSKLKQVLIHAKKAGVIQNHNFHDIGIPVKIDAEINPLTLDEVQLLAQSPVNFNIQIKQAFLLSCFTGLRQSDVMNLKWSNIDLNEGIIKILPLKTSNRKRNIKNIQGKILEAPLTESAKKLLSEVEKKQGTDLVFFDLPVRQIIGKHLMIWGLKLGLKKHIHFHLGRHTFATIGITFGIDVYGMQKLLLHSKIEQTQRYAKVVEQKTKNDVSKFPTVL
jgi:integrase